MSDSDTFQVEDLSSLHKYRTELPNIILDMGLDPYEFTLYSHLKRIAGDKGNAEASNKYLAKVSCMSIDKVKKVKKILVERNLIKTTIRQNKDKSFKPTLIQIIDWWPQNFEYFKFKKKERENKLKEFLVGDEKAEGWVMRKPRVGDENIPKEEPIKKNHIKNNKPIRAGGGPKYIQLRKKVRLTEKQLDGLSSVYSKEEVDWILDKLNRYKTFYNQEYSSDIRPIKKWVIGAMRNERNKAEAKNNIKARNISIIKEIQDALERKNKKGNLKIQGDEAIDSVFFKSCNLDNPGLPQIVAKWYRWNWED